MQYGLGYSQGTERYLAILSAGMSQRGCQVDFVAGDPENRAALRPDDPAILRVPTSTWLAVAGAPAEAYLPRLRERRPDVIHLANPGHIGLGLVDAAAALRIPVVITVMDYWWLCPKHTLHHFRRGICDGEVTWRECARCIAATHESPWLRAGARLPLVASTALPIFLLARAAARGVRADERARWRARRPYIRSRLNMASAVIFPSRTAQRLIAPLLDGPSQANIPYGLEARWFAAADRSNQPRTNPVLGFAGALQPHKGVHLILQAMRRLRLTTVLLRIAGGGDPRYERELHRQAQGLRVEFVGRVTPDAMPAFLRSLDLLIVPSLWPENLPIIVLEASAARVPVLASDVGGIRELVTDPALRFAPGSVHDLAQRLDNWLTRRPPTTFPAISTAEAMCAATRDVYENAVRDAPVAGGPPFS